MVEWSKWNKEEAEKEKAKQILKIKKTFKKRYEKNISVCEDLAKEHKGIYGAVVWSGGSGLPWYLSFDLDKVIDYAISNTNWKAHPDLTRVEFIKFGKHPIQEVIGYIFSEHIADGYVHLHYEE